MKEGHKLRAHVNTAPFPAPHSPHVPWPRPRHPRSNTLPEEMGVGIDLGHCSSPTQPAKLSGRAHEMSRHVSRSQRRACEE